MQLISLVAKRHGVGGEQAYEILWRRCISRRVRLAARLLSGVYPRRREELRRMVRGFGLCESPEAAAADLGFYEKQQSDRGWSPASLFLSFSPRRMFRTATVYFAEEEAQRRLPPVAGEEATGVRWLLGP